MVGCCIYFGLRIFGRPVGNWRRAPSALGEAEDAVLSSTIKSATFKHNWMTVTVPAYGSCELHSLVAWKGAQEAKPVLCVLHGTAGSSVRFSPVIDRLSETFVVHCLDLPGFGKSSAPPAWRYCPKGDIMQLYIFCLASYLSNCGLEKVSLLGHSFGGYIATVFIEQHLELVDSIILASTSHRVNPAGIFPTLGRTGAYWALIFKSSLPQSLLRAFGPAGAIAFRAYCYLANAHHFATYYYQLLAAPDGFADTFVGRFIKVGFAWSYWMVPSLRILLSTPVPLGFIYGADDDIMPVHQPRTVIKVSGARMPLGVVKDAGHSPFAERPEAFCDAFEKVHANVCAPGATGRLLAAKIEDAELLRFKSSYSLLITSESVMNLYSWLVSLSGGTTANDAESCEFTV